MNNIISIYKTFQRDPTGVLVDSHLNINWLKIKNDPIKEFLDFFMGFLKQGYTVYKIKDNLDKIEKYYTEEEQRYLTEYQFNFPCLNYDFVYFKENEKYIFPKIDYFSAPYFIFGDKETIKKDENLAPNNLIYEEIDLDTLSVKNKTILVKGESYLTYFPIVLVTLREAIKQGKFKTKASLFFAFLQLMNNIKLSNEHSIAEKLRLDKNALKSILYLKYTNRLGFVRKIDKFLSQDMSFIIMDISNTSALFQYIIYTYDYPNEFIDILKSIISILNSIKVKSFSDIVSLFGLQKIVSCPLC